MALFATIPRNLMVDPKIPHLAKLVYGFYSMMLIGHKENKFTFKTVEHYLPFGLKQTIRYSEDLAMFHYITFRRDDFHLYVSVPENVHARVDGRVDQSIQIRKDRYHKDCDYVAKTVVAMHGQAMTEQFGKPHNPKVTESVMKSINARLKSFKSGEIIDACQNRIDHIKVDPWWNESQNKRFKKNLFNLINTDDKLDKWLHIDLENGKQGVLTSLNLET
jgi:hypothetical protein